jgi:hypothetical protein
LAPGYLILPLRGSDLDESGRSWSVTEEPSPDIIVSYGYQKDSLRIAGCKLPPTVPEKFQHCNVQMLIPELAKK